MTKIYKALIWMAVSASLAQAQTQLTASPTVLNYLYKVGDPTPAPIQVGILSNIPNTAFTVPSRTSNFGSWLGVSPGSGIAPTTLVVTCSPAGMDIGQYSATISITSTDNKSTVVIP